MSIAKLKLEFGCSMPVGYAYRQFDGKIGPVNQISKDLTSEVYFN